jgi:RNA polymerase sigma factor (sigma-70 family)
MTPAEQRLETLVLTHGRRVLAYLARRTTPVEDAADVYQEVLTTVWRKLHAVPDDHDHALAWLLAVARGALANHRRSQTRRLAATDRLASELSRSAAAGAETSEALDAVREALAGLGADDREVLTLTYWDGLSAEQVAVVLDITAAAARKRLQRARERLSSVLPVTQANRDGDRAEHSLALSKPSGP